MPIPKQSNIVGYWKGNLNQDGTLQDFNPNPDATLNHGTLVSAPPQVGTPFATDALDYDGSADFTRVTDNASLDITGDKTISALVKLDEAISANGIIVMKAIDADNYYALGWHTTDGIFLQIQDTTTNYVVKTNELSTGIWFHIIGTYTQSDNSIVVYLNSVDKSISSVGTMGDPSDTNLTIGARDGQNDQFFEGIISHLITYNVVLNSNEVLQLYNEIIRLTAR